MKPLFLLALLASCATTLRRPPDVGCYGYEDLKIQFCGFDRTNGSWRIDRRGPDVVLTERSTGSTLVFSPDEGSSGSSGSIVNGISRSSRSISISEDHPIFRVELTCLARECGRIQHDADLLEAGMRPF